VKDAIEEYLAKQHVEIRKVEEAEPKATAAENLKVVSVEGMPDVFHKARAAGASNVLFLTVDRPVTALVKLKMQCFDLTGTELWEETASPDAAGYWLAIGAVKSAVQRMKAQLAARMGQPGLVQAAENASATRLAVASVPGPAPSAGTQAAQKESALAQSPTLQAAAGGPESGQTPPGAIAQDATVTLPEGTLVRFMLVAPVDSKTARVGDKVEFRVLEDVKVGDLVAIPRGAPASGVVSELIAPRRRERPGRITVKAQTVSLLNNQPATLRGARTIKSGNTNVSLQTTEDINTIIQATSGWAFLSCRC
jgi:hypothetical protein